MAFLASLRLRSLLFCSSEVNGPSERSLVTALSLPRSPLLSPAGRLGLRRRPTPTSLPSCGVRGNLPLLESPVELAGLSLRPFQGLIGGLLVVGEGEAGMTEDREARGLAVTGDDNEDAEGLR